MRREWYTLLVLMSLVALGPLRADARLRVVATTEHYAALARLVGGERITVTYLVRGDQDPHAVEPKRSFTALLNRADLLIVNGQGLEAAWLPTVLADSANGRIWPGNPGYLDASKDVRLLPYDPEELERPVLLSALVGLAGLLGATGPDKLPTQNHHYWLDPANGAPIARAIAERLVRLDPGNAAFYQENSARFATALQEKLAAWDAMLHPFAGAGLVSYHRSWTYLASRHGLKVVGYIEPKEPLVLGPTNVGRLPDGEAIAALVATMQQRVRLVVAETYSDRAIAERVATGAGAHLLLLPASVSQREDVGDYFQFFDRVYQEFVKALQGAGK